MIEFYPQIKWVHVAAVLFSGGLFATRGLAMLAGARWFMAAPLRYLSYTVDTVLLTAALMLATLLHQYPFVHGWLTAKVLLLVVYVVLGSYALKRGATRVVRAWSFVAALLVYGFIISVAHAHVGPRAYALSQCAAVRSHGSSPDLHQGSAGSNELT
jgi:uncharacterized membrane protein SirB2